MTGSSGMRGGGVLRFAEFELDLDSCELRKHGAVTRLQPQPAKVLLLLTQAAGRLVTREEIRQAIWNTGTFVDFEQGLNYCIRQIRAVLDDDADRPRFIETVPRRGYRFVAAVEPSREPISARIRLVVLPFACLTPGDDQSFLSDGFTEELITELGKLDPQRLAVIARGSTMKYKGTNAALSQIAAELRVQYILEGSIRRSQDRIRLSAQLIRAADEEHIWAQSYERPLSDILAVQAELGRNVARSLSLKLFVRPLRPVDSSAYQAYLKGRYHWNRLTIDGVRKSIPFYQEAIALDPEFALAYAGLADSYIQLGSVRLAALPPRVAIKHARVAADKALVLDDSLAEVHFSQAMIQCWYDWDLKTSRESFERALELDPQAVIIRLWYAMLLLLLGDAQRARAEITHARESDPLSVNIATYAGVIKLLTGSPEAGLAEIDDALDLDPAYYRAHYFRAQALCGLGRCSEAVEVYRKALDLQPGEPAVLSQMVSALAHCREREAAKKIVEDLLTRSKQEYIPAALIAIAWCGLDELDRAFEWLERAFEERSNHLMLFGVEIAYRSARADVRGKALLKRLGLPAQSS